MNVNNDSISEEEYELQYFKFSSNDFITHFIHIVSSEISNVFEEYLGLAKTILEFGTFKTLQQFKQDIIVKCNLVLEEEMKKVKLIVQQFFSIPKNIVIPDDSLQKKQYSKEEVQKLNEELMSLEKELIKEQLFLNLCKKELDILNKLENTKLLLEDTLDRTNGLKDSFKDYKQLTQLSEGHKKAEDLVFTNPCTENKDNNGFF